MKIKFNSYHFVHIIIILYIVILAVCYVFGSYVAPPSSPVNAFNGLPQMHDNAPDTLTWHEYDKATGTHSTYFVNKNLVMYGSGGTNLGFIGTTQGLYCDTCSIRWYATKSYKDEAHKKYYIQLDYWKLKSNTTPYWYVDSVKFHVEHGQGYIRKAIKTNEIHQKDGQYFNAYLADVPVKFKYNQKEQSLLIPVGKSFQQFMTVVLLIVGIAWCCFCLYLIRAFLNFTLDLSKGLAFTDKNIFRLKLMAAALILTPVAAIFFTFLIRLLFYSYFTPDVILNNELWGNSEKPIGIGLVFLLLYRAFKQGKLLKDEQDLTV